MPNQATTGENAADSPEVASGAGGLQTDTSVPTAINDTDGDSDESGSSSSSSSSSVSCLSEAPSEPSISDDSNGKHAGKADATSTQPNLAPDPYLGENFFVSPRLERLARPRTTPGARAARVTQIPACLLRPAPTTAPGKPGQSPASGTPSSGRPPRPAASAARRASPTGRAATSGGHCGAGTVTPLPDADLFPFNPRALAVSPLLARRRPSPSATADLPPASSAGTTEGSAEGSAGGQVDILPLPLQPPPHPLRPPPASPAAPPRPFTTATGRRRPTQHAASADTVRRSTAGAGHAAASAGATPESTGSTEQPHEATSILEDFDRLAKVPCDAPSMPWEGSGTARAITARKAAIERLTDIA